MKILFLCTAHNSLSQQLYLRLCQTHTVTVEYALSDKAMIEAASLAQPDIIICPFLTSAVPSEVFENYLTLIIHPGPPGDAGPSALDWVLMGDDGTVSDPAELLKTQSWNQTGRSHWGVTVLQAVAEMDAGPVWAFEQFKIDINEPGTTKATLYRDRVTQAAITAALAALNRITSAADGNSITVHLQSNPTYRTLSVSQQQPFLGGPTHCRPLLRAADRNFDIQTESAKTISRKIRSSDSQPGCLTKLFGSVNLYVYGGVVEAGRELTCKRQPGEIIGCRNDAVCVATCDGMGIWITHVRRLKRKVDTMLWPKVPAVPALIELGLISQSTLTDTTSLRMLASWDKACYSTYQDIWIDFAFVAGEQRIAFVYFEFYNGAMSTSQCSRLIDALQFVATIESLEAVVLMGGESYFSNGIALNVIEASSDPSAESWRNINRIDDVVQMLLEVFPQRNVMTITAVRGNCAAGGVALATACDVVIASSESVLNPAYRALGLYGSEYHSLSYTGRCGTETAKRILREMLPISTHQAQAIGLIDHVLPGSGTSLDIRVKEFAELLVRSPYKPGNWKLRVDVSPSGLASARVHELSEMAQDFWSARSERYTSRRRDFVRKIKATKTPLRFATHRRREGEVDEEEADSFDDVAKYEARALQKILEERFQKRDGPLIAHHQDIKSHDDGVVIRSQLLDGKRSAQEGKAILFPCYYEVDTPVCT
ncbi:sensor hoxx [Fusarium longipes]|uniref:Sensor hoxx n=1 Tax=Fusarium longipes TaxID=694270 RepID=A0A395S3S4_9HYPO|nr:sensor hoxx [Fusarium longipes]